MAVKVNNLPSNSAFYQNSSKRLNSVAVDFIASCQKILSSTLRSRRISVRTHTAAQVHAEVAQVQAQNEKDRLDLTHLLSKRTLERFISSHIEFFMQRAVLLPKKEILSVNISLSQKITGGDETAFNKRTDENDEQEIIFNEGKITVYPRLKYLHKEFDKKTCLQLNVSIAKLRKKAADEFDIPEKSIAVE